MNKKAVLVILIVLLAALTWYTTRTAQQTVGTGNQLGKQVSNVSVTQPIRTPIFKISREAAYYGPKTLNATVKNIGNGTGSVRVIGQVFYAGVVSDEKSIVLNDIAPGQEVNFSIQLSKVAQWVSYKITTETIKSS